MDALLSALGLAQEAEDFLKTMVNQTVPRRVAGVDGSGANLFADCVAAKWGSEIGTVLEIVGNASMKPINLGAIFRFANNNELSKAKDTRDQRLIGGVMRAIPNIGSLIGAYLENMHGKRAAQGPDFLSQDEQFCLTAMERMSYSENVLVVVRNVELLDDGSIRLLERMDIPEVKGSYRFLKKASFLFLEQAVNTEIGEAARTQQLRELAIWSRTIYPPDQGQFEKFLRALGLRIELDTGIFTALYNVTGGHVVLSQMLVDELNQGADANQFSDMDSFADLATRLIGIRLRSAADSKDDLTQLLALAACIGTPFNRTQLECAFVRKPRFLRILDLAKDSRYFREDVS